MSPKYRNRQPLRGTLAIHTRFICSLLCLLSTIVFASSVVAQTTDPGFRSNLLTDEMRFPYQALVLNDGASVHSGPDSVHYATDRLEQGQLVDVHRHDPGGWCAIRPIEGSFSLIPESAIEVVGDNTGKLTADGVQAWVGTRLGPVENPMWQVKLRKDELVKLLGEVSWPSPEGHSTIWYQIAAPAGEFRWIKMSDLQLPADQRLSTKSSTSQIESEEPARAPVQQTFTRQLPSGESQPGSQPDSSSDKWLNAGPGQKQMQPIQTRPNRASRVETEIASNSAPSISRTNLVESEGSDPGVRLVQGTEGIVNHGWRPASKPFGNRAQIASRTISNFENPTSAPRSYAPPTIPDANVFAEPIGNRSTNSANRRIGDSENARFAEVGSNIAQQSYESTYDVTPKIASAPSRPVSAPRSTEPISRGDYRMQNPSSRLLAVDIELSKEMGARQPEDWQLDNLSRQTQEIISRPTGKLEEANAKLLAQKIENCRRIQVQHKTAFAPNARSKADQFYNQSYDATGWLNELVRDNGSSESTYVLQNDQGNITHHVSAADGVDLKAHLKTRIGIVGRRGYHRLLKMDHVLAQKVIPLRD